MKELRMERHEHLIRPVTAAALVAVAVRKFGGKKNLARAMKVRTKDVRRALQGRPFPKEFSFAFGKATGQHPALLLVAEAEAAKWEKEHG